MPEYRIHVPYKEICWQTYHDLADLYLAGPKQSSRTSNDYQLLQTFSKIHFELPPQLIAKVSFLTSESIFFICWASSVPLLWRLTMQQVEWEHSLNLWWLWVLGGPKSALACWHYIQAIEFCIPPLSAFATKCLQCSCVCGDSDICHLMHFRYAIPCM